MSVLDKFIPFLLLSFLISCQSSEQEKFYDFIDDFVELTESHQSYTLIFENQVITEIQLEGITIDSFEVINYLLEDFPNLNKLFISCYTDDSTWTISNSYSNLKKLHVECDSLNSIKDFKTGFTNLEYLSLPFCSIDDFSFFDLPSSLVERNLNYKAIESLNVQNPQRFANLKMLNLNRTHLKSISNEIYSIKSIEKLNLFIDDIDSTLQVDLCEFDQLTHATIRERNMNLSCELSENVSLTTRVKNPLGFVDY